MITTGDGTLILEPREIRILLDGMLRTVAYGHIAIGTSKEDFLKQLNEMGNEVWDQSQEIGDPTQAIRIVPHETDKTQVN